MTQRSQTSKAMLLATAQEVAHRLRLVARGTSLRVRVPRRATQTNTDGWDSVIGDLGKDQPRLVVWLDKFAGYTERKFYAGFCSSDAARINGITEAVSKNLWPIRVITDQEIAGEKRVVLVDRVRRSEFNAPFYEDYPNGLKFYGVYNWACTTTDKVNSDFCNRAVAFFEDVARSLPNATSGDGQREVYPQCENRKWVTSHLHRERSGLLVAECKIRDGYRCQVCGLRFEDVYGKLGIEFAEAHHIVPLSKLSGTVKTGLEDLVTVCANCHRMLHRMSGHPDDVKNLRAIVRRDRK